MAKMMDWKTLPKYHFLIWMLLAVIVGAIGGAIVVAIAPHDSKPPGSFTMADARSASYGVLESYCKHNNIRPNVFREPVVERTSIAPEGKPGLFFTYTMKKRPHRRVVILWDVDNQYADIVDVE